MSGEISDPAASNGAPPAVAVNDESLSPAVTDEQNVEAAELIDSSGATCSHEVVRTEVECEPAVVNEDALMEDGTETGDNQWLL